MQPIENARLRPIRAPILPPVIMSAAITSAYRVIAVWTPVTVVFMSLATVAIATFITDVSSVIRNCAAQSVTRTSVAPAIATLFAVDASMAARAYWKARPIQSPETGRNLAPTAVRFTLHGTAALDLPRGRFDIALCG